MEYTSMERLVLWSLPVTQYTWFHRVLDVVSRQILLPEEGEARTEH